MLPPSFSGRIHFTSDQHLGYFHFNTTEAALAMYIYSAVKSGHVNGLPQIFVQGGDLFAPDQYFTDSVSGCLSGADIEAIIDLHNPFLTSLGINLQSLLRKKGHQIDDILPRDLYGLSEGAAVAYVLKLMDDHPIYFSSLKEAVAEGHELHFFPGNHDFFIMYPLVQRVIRAYLSSDQTAQQRVRFAPFGFYGDPKKRKMLLLIHSMGDPAATFPLMHPRSWIRAKASIFHSETNFEQLRSMFSGDFNSQFFQIPVDRVGTVTAGRDMVALGRQMEGSPHFFPRFWGGMYGNPIAKGLGVWPTMVRPLLTRPDAIGAIFWEQLQFSAKNYGRNLTDIDRRIERHLLDHWATNDLHFVNGAMDRETFVPRTAQLLEQMSESLFHKDIGYNADNRFAGELAKFLYKKGPGEVFQWVREEKRYLPLVEYAGELGAVVVVGGHTHQLADRRHYLEGGGYVDMFWGGASHGHQRLADFDVSVASIDMHEGAVTGVSNWPLVAEEFKHVRAFDYVLGGDLPSWDSIAIPKENRREERLDAVVQLTKALTPSFFSRRERSRRSTKK